MARTPAGVFTLTRGIGGLAAGRVLPSPVLACLRRLAGGPACCALGRREAKPGEPEGSGPDDEPEGSGPEDSRPDRPDDEPEGSRPDRPDDEPEGSRPDRPDDEPEDSRPDRPDEPDKPDGSRPAGAANGSKELRAGPPEGRRGGR